MARKKGSTIVVPFREYKELKDSVACLKLEVDVLQTQIALVTGGASDVSAFTSAATAVTANVPLTVVSGFTNIIDVSIYDSITGDEIDDSFEIQITGGNVIIESNNNVSNLVIKVIGN